MGRRDRGRIEIKSITHVRGLGAHEQGEEAVVLHVAGACVAPDAQVREGEDEGVVWVGGLGLAHALEEVRLCGGSVFVLVVLVMVMVVGSIDLGWVWLAIGILYTYKVSVLTRAGVDVAGAARGPAAQAYPGLRL